MGAQIINLTSVPNQSLAVSLSINGVTIPLNLRLSFNEMGGFWWMGISDQTDVPMCLPVPLLTGVWPAGNMLAPYQYMNIGSAFVINSTGVTVPDYPNGIDLGTDFILLWTDNADYIPGTEQGPNMTGIVGPPGPQGPPGVVGGYFMLPTSGDMTPQPGDTQFTQLSLMTGAGVLKPPTPKTGGALFLVCFRQPHLGGCQMTFDPYYKGMFGVMLDTTGDTQATLMFQIAPDGLSAQMMWVMQNGWSIL